MQYRCLRQCPATHQPTAPTRYAAGRPHKAWRRCECLSEHDERRWGASPGHSIPKAESPRIVRPLNTNFCRTRLKNRPPTRDRGGVSSPVTAINVVRAHDRTNKLLCDVVQFVRSLGAAEHAEVARISLCNGGAERLGHTVHCFVPCGRAMYAVFAHQRLCQPGFS